MSKDKDNGSIFELYDDRFLGKWNFEDGEDIVVTIDRAGRDKVFTKGKPEEKTILYFTDSKPMVLNKTNAKMITRVLGTDKRALWHGKKISLYVDKTVRNPTPGELPGGIRVRPHAPKTDTIVCADCGLPIQDTEIGGKMYKARAIAENARTKFGRVLCADCARIAKEKEEGHGEQNREGDQ